MRFPFGLAICGFLALCLSMAGPATAEEEGAGEPRAAIVLVNCQNHAGVAIEGVEFSIGVPGEDPVLLQTDEFGMIRLEVENLTGDTAPHVRVADDRFAAGSTLYSRRQSRRGETHHFLFQLFRSDPERMTQAERRSYLEALPAMLRRQRMEEGPANLPLSLAVFLDGVRSQVEDESEIEFPPAPEPAEEAEDGEESEPVVPEPDPPGVVVTVLDSMGQPAHRRLVLLWTDRGDDESIHAVRRGRTAEDGSIRFGGLEEGRLYRAETAPVRDGLLGRGSPFRAQADRFVELPPLVLRQTDRVLTGFVFDGERAVRGARLRVRPSNQPELEAVTNEFGYFDLGPLRPGDVPLLVQERNGGEVRVPSLRAGRSEKVLPMELLRIPPASPAQ